MRKTYLAMAAAALILSAGSTAALAQFSSDPVNLEFVCDATGDQVQSKIAVASNGTFYVAWFDTRTPGYDVYLQRYNADGVEQWQHNGILVADRAVSSTNDWDLDVDASGNAIVSYGDTGSSVAVSKVSTSGTILWTTVVGTGGALQPKAAVLSDGSIIVGWNQAGATLQRVSQDGALTGNPLNIAEPTHFVNLSDVQPGGNDGSFIVLWIRGATTNFMSNKWLYTQKFDTANAPMWTGAAANNAVVVYGPPQGSAYPVGTGTYGTNGGSIQNGYFPTFLSDGQGGAVYSWYENAGPRTAYLQKVAANGTVAWPVNGLPVVSEAEPAWIKTGAGLSYNAATGEAFVAWSRTGAANQNVNNFVRVQKFLADGSLAWGPAGVEVQPDTSVQPSFVQTVASGGGCYVLSLMGAGTATGKVLGAYVSSDGSLPFAPFNVCDLGGNKARLSSGGMPDGSAVFAFSHGPTGGGSDLYLGNLRADGTQGVATPACAADLGIQGGFPGSDNQLDNNDFIAFINYFFASDPHADMGVGGGFPGQDGAFDNNDFIAFINAFFNGCS